MKVLGIIAEYNPFHFGHLYHLKKSKDLIQADYTIAVMSGNFTQRGEVAITDKWVRAEAAVRCGIDLVLELPVVYAVQTAELFAYGGIQMLNHTGLTTHVSFGSEIGSLEPLEAIADVFVSEDQFYKDLLKSNLDLGLSFPAARYRAVMEYMKSQNNSMNSSKGSIGSRSSMDSVERFDANNAGAYGISGTKNDSDIKKILAGSNSILAIEYLKALKQTNSSILPITISRISSAYRSNRIKKGAASATSIRGEIFHSGMSRRVREAMPEATFQVLSDAFEKGMGPMDNNGLENLILGLIRRSSAAEIASWMDVSEGLENRIKESAQKVSGLDELLSMIKTKRYVHTRLQRILIHGLLGLTTETFSRLNDNIGPKYLRILAFSKEAAPLLKRLKEAAQVPVLTKAAHITRYDAAVQEMFAFDRLASDLYGLGIKNPLFRRGDRDYTHGIVRI